MGEGTSQHFIPLLPPHWRSVGARRTVYLCFGIAILLRGRLQGDSNKFRSDLSSPALPNFLKIYGRTFTTLEKWMYYHYSYCDFLVPGIRDLDPFGAHTNLLWKSAPSTCCLRGDREFLAAIGLCALPWASELKKFWDSGIGLRSFRSGVEVISGIN